MALPKIQEVRDMSDSEIADQILAVKKELFQLRMQQGTRQLEKPHLFKHAKHRLAQLMTVEHERKLKAAAGDS
jgi:large subunit ribosomal protein L29